MPLVLILSRRWLRLGTLYLSNMAIFCTVVFNSMQALGTQPQRIVSCTLATDEIAFAILSSTHHLQRLVAVSRYADDLTYSNIPSIPATLHQRCGTSPEALLSLRPDLVLLAPYSRPEWLKLLKTSGISTFVTESPKSLDSIARTILELGRVLGEESGAKTVYQEMQDQRQQIALEAKALSSVPIKLLHIFSDGAVSGQDTMFDAIAKEIGAINAASAVKGWVKLSGETLLQLNPDFIIASGDELHKEATLKALRAIPGLQETKVFSRQNIIMIPDRELSSVSHHVTKGIFHLLKSLQKLAPEYLPNAPQKATNSPPPKLTP